MAVTVTFEATVNKPPKRHPTGTDFYPDDEFVTIRDRNGHTVALYKAADVSNVVIEDEADADPPDDDDDDDERG